MTHVCPYEDCGFAPLDSQNNRCPACDRPVYFSGQFDFTDIIVDRTQGFTGRDWVFQQVNDWLADPHGNRVFFLSGGPGSGKSALAARLVQIARGEVDAEKYPVLTKTGLAYYHFCRAQDDPMLEPVGFVRSMSLALAARYPAFASLLAQADSHERNIQVEQIVGNVETGGSVAGVVIHNLHISGLTARQAFARVVYTPLEQARIGDTVFILVDALDEALTFNDQSNIVTLLQNVTDDPHDLPPNVRMLFTGRPDPRVLELMPTPALALVDDEPDSRHDVELYAKRRLDALATAQLTETERDALAAEIASVGKGNFLYARYVLDDLPKDVQDMASLTLPAGLEEVYARFLKRELARQGRTWRAYRPIMSALAVARGNGLTLHQLAGALGIQPSAVEELLEPCMQYLSGRFPAGPFRLYHQSFRDFLLEQDEYAVYPEEAHLNLAEFFLTQHNHAWADCDDLYALAYTPSHLIASIAGVERRDVRDDLLLRLADLFKDMEFLESKTARFQVFNTLTDLQATLRVMAQFGHEIAEIRDLSYLLQLESHHLRYWNQEQQPSLFAQQLLYRAAISNMPGYITLVADHLSSHNMIYFAPQWSTVRQSSALRGTLVGHSGLVWAVAVTPDGRRAISAGDDETLIIWRLDSGLAEKTLIGHSGRARAVVVTPDGHRVLSAGADQLLRVWDLESKTLECILGRHQAEILALAVTSSGKTVISGAADGALKVWDIDSRQLLHEWRGHSTEVRSLAVLPGDTQVISASADRTLKVWDLATGIEQFTLAAHSGTLRAVAVTPDARLAIAAASDQALQVWDLNTHRMLYAYKEHRGRVRSVAVIGQGERAISGDEDRLLRLWDLKTGQSIGAFFGHAGTIWSIATIPGTDRVISGSEDHTLKIWSADANSSTVAATAHTSRVLKLAISADGRKMVSASQDNTLKVWNTDSGQLEHTLIGHARAVYGLAMTPDGRYVVSGSQDKSIIVWDLNNGVMLRRLRGHRARILDVSLTPDCRRVLSTSRDRTLRVWDIETGALLHTLTGHKAPVVAVRIMAGGRQAVTASIDQTLKVWDLYDGTCLRTIEGNAGPILAIAMASDGRRLISASTNAELRLWDLSTGKTIHHLVGHAASTSVITVTAENDHIISASADGTVIIWNMDTGEPLHILTGHVDSVQAVSTLADLVISVSADETIRLWDSSTGQEIGRIALESSLLSLEVFSEKSLIVTGDRAGNVYGLQLVSPPTRA